MQIYLKKKREGGSHLLISILTCKTQTCNYLSRAGLKSLLVLFHGISVDVRAHQLPGQRGL